MSKKLVQKHIGAIQYIFLFEDPVRTLFKKVMTSLTYLFSAIYRGRLQNQWGPF